MASPLNNFIPVGPRTSLFTPQRPTSGQLIIICTWLGAARKHITKYTTLYQRIAPGSRILLIESNVPILISSYVRQRNAIKPAVSIILNTLAECNLGPVSSEKTDVASNGHISNGNIDGSVRSSTSTLVSKPRPKILLHTFSNGGTNTATQLLLVFHSNTKAALPLTGLLCDSGPAKGTYWRSYDAMVLSLPNDLASRLLGALACHCILTLLYTWIACGNENPASLFRRTILDREIVYPSWKEKEMEMEMVGKAGEGRVCYFYSKADRMCLWSDVRDHAEEAKRKGWEVKEFLFEGSGHCAHLSNDEERYAMAVKSIWDVEGAE